MIPMPNNEAPCLSVPDFYAGRSVFLTGGTGFLGMVFLEKLLYSCPKINKVYVLIRMKKDLSAAQRVQEMTDSPVFTRIKKEKPEVLSKIVPIPGDIATADLGIQPADETMLINEVSVVFHSAASVKFNEPISKALNINLEGARRVLSLCHRMKCIEVFVHISTMFSNIDRDVIQEIVYPPPKDLAEVYKLVKEYGDDPKMIARMIEGHPNTYTFTKALIETMICQNRGDIPVVIVRPSIVTPSIEEPIRGWIDNWYGATSLLTAIAMGVCRAVVGRKHNVLDIIPVDYVSNLTLISAAKFNRQGKLTVLNCCSSDINPITLKQMSSLYAKESVKNGFNIFPFPGLILITQYKWIVAAISLLIRTFAYILDFVLRIIGRKPRFVKTQKNVDFARNVVEYFTTHTWVTKCDGVRALYHSLSPKDQQEFPCDPALINWRKYMPIYYEGVSRYLLKNKK